MFWEIVMILSAVAAVTAYVVDCVYLHSFGIILLPVVFALCFIGLFILWAVIGVISALVIDTKKEYKKSEWIFRFYSDSVLDVVIWALHIKVHLSGLDSLPDRNFLLIGNHKSAIDPILEMRYLSKCNLGFIAKKELFRIPIISRFMHKRFCLSLDRDNPRSELETILKAINKLKEGIASIGIYPEGRRNPNNTLLPFKSGAFKIAQKAKCPIVIAVITNSEFVKKNAPFKRTDVYIDFVSIPNIDYIINCSTEELSGKIKTIMEEKLKNRKELF